MILLINLIEKAWLGRKGQVGKNTREPNIYASILVVEKNDNGIFYVFRMGHHVITVKKQAVKRHV